MKTQQLGTSRFVLMTLAFGLVAFTVPVPADNLGVKFKEVTFTDSSTPRFNAPCRLVQGNRLSR